MAISPDGSRLVLLRVVNWNIEWTIWSLKSGRQLLAFRHRTERYARDEKVSFSPDGNRLVAIFHPSPLDIKLKPIQVWDATPLPEEPETK